jgi:hypothetical protein
MKKNKIFYSVATAAATLVMTAAPMVSTFAATDVSKQSDATFTVTEDTTTKPVIPDTDQPDTNQTGDGALQLVAVPSFDFGTVSTSELIAGKTGMTVGNIAQNPMKDDGSGNMVAATDDGATSGKDANGAPVANSNYHLTVSDLRGKDNDWDLTATMSNFKSDDGKSTLTGKINLKSTFHDVEAEYTGGNFTTDYLTLKDFSNMDQVLTTGSATDLYNTTTADSGKGKGKGRGINVAALGKSTLDLGKNATATAGHYTATIDWELKSVVPTPGA